LFAALCADLDDVGGSSCSSKSGSCAGGAACFFGTTSARNDE
jgi:hypothetical protein